MDSIVFHVAADKIGPSLADSIKAYFGNRRIRITVMADEPATDEAARNEVADDDRDYALPYDEIARITDALERNEPVDVAAEMKKFMDIK